MCISVHVLLLILVLLVGLIVELILELLLLCVLMWILLKHSKFKTGDYDFLDLFNVFNVLKCVLPCLYVI